MRAYYYMSLWLLIIIISLFAIAEGLQFEQFITDASPWIERQGYFAGVFSISLLCLDVILPIPSSLIMTLNGTVFGPVWGALISLIGGVASVLFGWWIGYRSQGFIVQKIEEKERIIAHKYLTKWGPLAILFSRPLPIISEIVAIMAGTLPIPIYITVCYSILGYILPCIFYAYIGWQGSQLITWL